jgi:hypothetical protein
MLGMISSDFQLWSKTVEQPQHFGLSKRGFLNFFDRADFS